MTDTLFKRILSYNIFVVLSYFILTFPQQVSAGTWWSDSYAVNGSCYCESTYDHELTDINKFYVQTPDGTKLGMVQFCQKIGQGSSSGRVFYNDIHCGNGPANTSYDEPICPGIPTNTDNWTGDQCNANGPKWNLTPLVPEYGQGNYRVVGWMHDYIMTIGNTSAPTAAPTATPIQNTSSCSNADISGEGFVDITDYSLLVQNFFKGETNNPMLNIRADINKDNFVDLSDYSLLVQNFFQTCTTTQQDIVVQAEDYATGGEGIGYHDTDSVNEGGSYRQDGVDIKLVGSSQVVGWMQTGEWLEYDITVPATDTYSLVVTAGTVQNDASIKIEKKIGSTRTPLSTITLPHTGGYTNLQDYEAGTVPLSAGSQRIRLTVNKQWIDLDKIKFVRGGEVPTSTPGQTSTSTPTRTPTRTPTAIPTVSVAPGTAKAFPGAEGYGTDTKGGRGGKVVRVTNLKDDHNPGSLRYALEDETGPRIVVFTVGGTIKLNSMISVNGKNGDNNITILGQTAPGGIQLQGYGISMKYVNDIIARYLKIRPGRIGHSSSDDIDAIELDGGWGTTGPIKNVVIDHVSAQWGWDENMSLYEEGSNVTFSYNLIAEAQASNANKGGNGKGLLVGSDNSNHRDMNISIHNNVFANNPDRNPRASASNLDMVNNIIYNWGGNNSTPLGNYHDFPNYPNRFNIINNVWKDGPSADENNVVIWLSNLTDDKVYLSGNYAPKCPSPCTNQWSMGIGNGNSGSTISSPGSLLSSTMFPSSKMLANPVPATQLWSHLKSRVGAAHPQRDAIDTRIINEIENNTGSLKNKGSSDADWADAHIVPGTYPTDSDADGIPDAWETSRGLNPNNAQDSASIAPSGYAWIEEYANSLVPTP